MEAEVLGEEGPRRPGLDARGGLALTPGGHVSVPGAEEFV